MEAHRAVAELALERVPWIRGSIPQETEPLVVVIPSSIVFAIVAGPLAPCAPRAGQEALPDGAPRFRAAEAMDIGFPPADVDLGDIDGDGCPEIVAADARRGFVRVLSACGERGGPPGGDLTLDAAPGRILLLDVDGDGDRDLVVAFRLGGGVLLLNDGGGRLSRGATLSLEADPAEIRAGDLDADGDPDLVTTHRGPGVVILLENRGEGVFETVSALRPGPSPTAAAIFEAHGGGPPVIAAGTGGRTAPPLASQVAFFSRGPSPGFAFERTVLGGPPGLSRLVPGDWDGDGAPELAAVITGSLTEGGGLNLVDRDGPAGEITGVGPNPTDASSADLDQDGSLDLVVANADMTRGSHTVSVLLRSGPRTFRSVLYSTPSRAERVIFADLDGDGRRDLVASSTTSREVSLIRVAPDGSLRAARRYPSLDAVTAVACGDLDGDGRGEVVAGADRLFGPDAVLLFPGRPGRTEGYPGDPIEIPGIPAPAALSVADLDGDGAADLAVAHRDAAGVTILRNVGGLRFQRGPELALPTRSPSIVSSDFDGDGRMDLAAATRERSRGRIDIFLGPGASGGASIRAQSTVLLSWEVLDLTAADLDGDRRPELIALQRAPVPAEGDPAPLRLAVAPNDGAGGFGPVAESFCGPGSFALAAVDVEGDGDVDVVTVDPRESALRASLNDGRGAFGDGGSIPLGAPGEDVVAADLDRDGDLDVAALLRSRGAIAVLLAAGGALLPAGEWRIGEETSSLAVGDLNGDGLADCAVAHIATGGVSVLLGEVAAGPLFVRGDADGSGGVDLSDAMTILGYLFLDVESSCPKAADTDDDGRVRIDDAIALLRYVSLGGPPPSPPFPECGPDPTADGVPCEEECR